MFKNGKDKRINMQIEARMNDRNGTPLNIGDKVELFNWGFRDKESLGIVTLCWDIDEGRVNCDPCIVGDAYDFWTKALPRSQKVG